MELSPGTDLDARVERCSKNTSQQPESNIETLATQGLLAPQSGALSRLSIQRSNPSQSNPIPFTLRDALRNKKRDYVEQIPISYSTLQCNTIPCNTMVPYMVPYNTVQHNKTPYNTIQYHLEQTTWNRDVSWFQTSLILISQETKTFGICHGLFQLSTFIFFTPP